MRKLTMLVSVVMVLLLVLSGCSRSPLIGKWENTQMDSSYEFKSNGEGLVSFFGMELAFEYEEDGEMITMTLVGDEAELLAADGDALTDMMPYEIKDDELNIMGTIFTKVK